MHFFFSGGKKKLWTPSKITTALWLDATDASTIILNGSTVSQWNDKSGNNRNVAQGTASRQPTYSTTGLDGKPALVWPDVLNTYLMKTAVAVDTQDVFVVARFRTGTQAAWLTVYQGLFGVGAGIGLIGIGSAPARWYGVSEFPQYRRNGGAEQSLADSITALPLPTSLLNSSRPSGAYTGTFVIGHDREEVANRGWSGAIAEVVVLSAIASTDTRQKLEGYLAWKWGFKASLPSDHPYKTKPPQA